MLAIIKTVFVVVSYVFTFQIGAVAGKLDERLNPHEPTSTAASDVANE
jgi:hypothetical protein